MFKTIEKLINYFFLLTKKNIQNSNQFTSASFKRGKKSILQTSTFAISKETVKNLITAFLNKKKFIEKSLKIFKFHKI